ncbi:cadherin-like beta sandwich domain-containing protein [Candidatus Poriferisocius sp.]|uniref:cadherin-like beta sandwich domain-containing protein n=1 Tax=Candidatus Poriferisocius sp. TaxID=3101276 RepID=UPI003B022438
MGSPAVVRQRLRAVVSLVAAVAVLGVLLTTPAVSAQQGNSQVGLSGLSLSPVGLHPAVFVASDRDYRAWAPHTVSSVRVTATARYGTESLTVNGVAVASGQASGPVALAVGSNSITVVATSSDGEASVSYSITVVRATEAQQSDASLAVLSVYRATSDQPDVNGDVSFAGSALALSPALSGSVREYRAELGESAGSYVAVSVVPAAGGAKQIAVKGPLPAGEQRFPKAKVSAGEAGGPWYVKVGYTPIDVEVTSLDGTSTETYRLIVKRGTVDDPKGLRAAPGDGQLTVHWDASESATAPNFYQARWRKSGETTWLNPTEFAHYKASPSSSAALATAADGDPLTPASLGSRTVSGLDNGTAYEVQVRAVRFSTENGINFKNEAVIDWLASDWHSLTATPAAPRTALAITPTRPTRPYGGADDLSFTVTGLDEGDTATDVVTGALARTAGDDAGTYAINMGTLAIASAHAAKYELPAAPTVTAYEITPLTIPSVTGVTVATRDADGTTTATFDTTAAVGTDVPAAELDDFRAGGLVVTGQFPTAAAGTHSVAVTYSLRDQGAFKAANYTLLTATATLTGQITAVETQPACTPAVNGDYDRDDDGLIEVCDLAQLNAIRFDNNGDANPDRGTAGEYTTAFPGIISNGPGCPIRCNGYELVTDLDLDTNNNGQPDSGDRYWNDGLGWAPMPIYNLRYNAVFEGNGHTISGLYMNKPGNMHRVGLFGTTGGGANVRNLILDGVEVRGGTGHMVAGLVGHNWGTISNVHVSGSVTGGYQDIGLLVGENRGRVLDSSAKGTVAGDNDVGLLVGENYTDVVRSNASGAATGRYSVGGLVGKQLGHRSTVISSSAVATVTGTTSASGGGRWIGGLVGDNDGKIRASMARATVTGSASAVGGLVGRNTGNVLATYATGSVDSTGSHIGGLIGQNNAYLKASYSVARTDGGGLVGSGSGTVTDSYWDTVASGTTTSATGTGLTTAALTAPSGYTGIYEDWNVDVDGDGRADSPWRFPAGGRYPLLRQLPASTSSATTGSILLTAAADPAGDDASDLELVSVSLPASFTISPALASDQSAYTITLPPYMAQVSLFGSFSDPSTAGYAYLAAAADLADFEAIGVNTANEHLLAQLSGGVVGAYETTLEGGESHTVQVGVYKWKPDEANQAPFADHTLKRAYTLTITRAQYPTDDTGLSHLSVSPGSIPFDPDTLSYRLDVASTISSITVTPRTSSPHATVTVAGEDPDTPVALKPGANHIDVVVTAEDGETTGTYRVTVSRARETKIRFTAVVDVTADSTDDMWITGLALPQGFTITPAFSPDQLDYQVIAPVEWDRVEVIGDYTTPYNGNGRGHYERTAYIFAASSLEEVGENWGDTWPERKTFPGQSQRIRGFLDSLHWDYRDGAFFHLTPGEATDIALVLHKWDRFKWYREGGRARIRPLLENSITKTYTLTVTRGLPDDDDARLDRLGTSAGPVALKDGVTEYALKVANSVSSLTVTPRTLHPSATATVDGGSADTPVALDYGDNAVSVVVTAVDGTTTKTYTLTVTRALPDAPTGTGTWGVDLDMGSATLKWSSAPTGVGYHEFRVRDSQGRVVATSTVDVPDKSATFTGLTAGAQYTFGLRAGNLGGTSAWSELTKTMPTPTELRDLDVSASTGGPLFQFRRGTTSYLARQSMMHAGIAQVQVRADAYNPQAAVTINGVSGASQSVDLSYGENLVTVVVSAEGETSTTYTVTLRRPPVVQLEGLELQTVTRGGSGGNARLAQGFAGWRTSYTAEVARGVLGLRVVPTVTAPKTATINGQPSNVNANTYVSLQRGKTNNIEIVVTQGSDSATYTVAVTVEGGNNTPTVASAIADVSGLEPDDTRQVSLSGVFNDADGDPLTVTAKSSAAAVATVSVASDGASVTVTAVKAGTATITVTADDGNDGAVSDAFDVTVDEANNAPTVASAIADIEGLAPNDTREVSLSGVFADADGDSLTVTVGSSKNAVAVARVNAAYTALTVRAVGEGTATMTVTADDGNGGSVSDAFDVTVELENAQATVASALDDVSGLEPGGTRQVSLSGVFDDPDGDTLTITAKSSDDAVATASVATGGASLTVTALKAGTATITVTADDGNGGTTSDAFDVTVAAAANRAPTIASAIADISGLKPGNTRRVTLAGVFNDADGDTPTIEAESSDDAVATVSVAAGGARLTVRALKAGTATITVTADDGNEGTATDTFTVTIDAANRAPAVVSAIANIGGLDPEDTRQVSLAGVFDDADGDTLTITVRSWNTTVATVSIAPDSQSLTVTAVGEGTAAITVTAKDGNRGRVTDRFTVTVGASEPQDAPEEEDVVARYDFNKDGIIHKSEYDAATDDIGHGIDYLDLVKIRAAWVAGGFQR